jgi:hypothetical protein
MNKLKLLFVKSIFVLPFFVIQCATARGLLEGQTTLSYPDVKPRIRITVVSGIGQEKYLPYFSDLTKQAAQKVESLFQGKFIDNFSIVFDNRQDFHNGLATVLPTNRIYVHTETPELQSTIGLEDNGLLDTTVHELTHMIVLQQRKGIFTLFNYAFGNLFNPNIFLPRWVHEGFAVWAESQGENRGRGNNGIIHADLRKFAEYQRRTNKTPFTSDLMDGSMEGIRYVHSGNYPYHMGYLLINDLFNEKTSKTPQNLFHNSSSNLGFFFHNLYRSNGKVMTNRFESLKKEWATTPLETDNSSKIVGAKQIRGPFLSKGGITWIQSESIGNDDIEKFSFHFSSDGKNIHTTQITKAGLYGSQVFWSPSLQHWIFLGTAQDFNSNINLTKSIFLIDLEGKIKCEIKEISRIRELAVNDTQIAWIRSSLDGLLFFEKAELNKSCQLSQQELIHKTEKPFERLSHPWVQGEDWLVSKSLGTNLSSDYLIGNMNFELHLKEGALGHPQRINLPDCTDCILSTLYSKEYRGPLIFNPQDKSLKRFTQLTESPASYALQEKIFSNQKLWDEDQLIFHESKQAFSLNAEIEKVGLVEKNLFKDEDVSPKSKKYSVWPSIVPENRFFSYISEKGGPTISGQTTISDLSNNWQGSLNLGYAAYNKRFFNDFSLLHNSLGWGPFDQWQIQEAKSFQYSQTELQDRLTVLTQFRALKNISTSFYAAVYPGLEYRSGSSAGIFKSFSSIIPAIGLKFASTAAVETYLQKYKITNFRNALYLSSKLRFLPETALEAKGNFQGKISKMGYLIGLEYAKTSPRSFPKSYYEWGGRTQLSSLDNSFLARGFPVGIGPSLQILKANAEIGFRLMRVNRGLPWNRFHLTDIELRPFYEVLTTDLYQIDEKILYRTSVRMGKEYFQTLGAEIDFFCQALHYFDFKASFGVYQGFGRRGSTQYGVKLTSLLDFL